MSIDDILTIICAIICGIGAISSLYGLYYIILEDPLKKLCKRRAKYDNYVQFQPNPVKKDTSDCSIRAVSKILNISWLEAFDLLVDYGRKYSEQPNNSRNINTVLYEKLDMHVYLPKKNITFEKFAHLHPKGTYALNSKGHICALVDGKLYDSWDSRTLDLFFYSTKEDNNDKDVTFDKEDGVFAQYGY